MPTEQRGVVVPRVDGTGVSGAPIGDGADSDGSTTPSTPRRRGAYAKSHARRQAILDAATAVFGAHGYRAGSLKDIAEVVGVNPSTLLHHFPTKEQLLHAVLDEHDRESDRLAALDAANPRDFPDSLVRIARNNEATPGFIGLYTLLAAESATPGHPGSAYFVARQRGIRAEFAEAFSALHRAGLLAPGVTVEYAAVSTLAIWDGVQLQWLIDPAAVEVPAVLQQHLAMLLGTADAGEWSSAV